MIQEQLVKEYQRTKAEDLLAEILKANDGLYYKWAREYHISGYDLEDLVQEAHIATLRAIESYREGQGILFTSYLKIVVKQAYNRLYTESHRQKRYNGSEAVSWEELEANNFEVSVELLSDLEVREFIGSLEGKVQEIAISLSNGLSKSDVAREWGVKPSTIAYYVRELKALACGYYGYSV